MCPRGRSWTPTRRASCARRPPWSRPSARAARNADARCILYADQVTARWSGRWPRPNAGGRSSSPKRRARHHAQSVKRGIADILDSVFERDHVRWIPGLAKNAVTIGHNSRRSWPTWRRRMRTAAADLDFEEAARLRDELLKRLQATELLVSDDPMARQGDVEREPGASAPSRAASRSRPSTTWGRAPTANCRSALGLAGAPQGALDPGARRPEAEIQGRGRTQARLIDGSVGGSAAGTRGSGGLGSGTDVPSHPELVP